MRLDRDTIKLIDKNLRSKILKVNRKGYKTLSCCSGHRNKNKIEEGYITFKGIYTLSQLEDLLNPIDITRLETDGNKTTTVRFKGLGGPRTCYKDSLEFQTKNIELNPLFWVLFRRNLNRIGFHPMSKKTTLICYSLSKTLKGKEIKRKELKDPLIWT